MFGAQCRGCWGCCGNRSGLAHFLNFCVPFVAAMYDILFNDTWLAVLFKFGIWSVLVESARKLC